MPQQREIVLLPVPFTDLSIAQAATGHLRVGLRRFGVRTFESAGHGARGQDLHAFTIFDCRQLRPG